MDAGPSFDRHSMGGGNQNEAIVALRRATEADPASAEAWRALGDQLYRGGDAVGGAEAYARSIPASVNNPELIEAAAALADGKLATAEPLLRARLKACPTDVAAMRMLAELGARLGRYEDAHALLDRALELAPGFAAARFARALMLSRQNRPEEALAEVDALIAREPRHIGYRNLKASIFVRVGDFAGAVTLYEAVLADLPDQPKIWMSLGHVLKTVGRAADGIAAYRRSIALQPGLGESWWSLANLKTYRFSEEDAATIRSALDRRDLEEEDALHLHFTLGKIYEDAGDYAASFDHYAKGNALRRAQLDYDAGLTTRTVDRACALFTGQFLADREGGGCDALDPIFILGLPRAGSTLIEQILASHSAVEGTMELPDIDLIARRLATRAGGDAYPEALATLSAGERETLGREYIDRTRIHRRLGRRFFIDKMPNNWMHVGLVHLILPNAKIIDARRHPMGCCFSAFKQHFARGQGFSYELGEVGRYYADYTALMAHFDALLPGRVHRVIYEAMVADPEAETKRLLAYCGLPFEDACLRFHENERAVRTASSEQVRKPIFDQAVDHWRHYEPWLDPLKTALGSSLQNWRD
jgi:tetratricopeptide (TPR) repeat protein